jgi:predicted transposase/invertase (TIGR01784 family)
MQVKKTDDDIKIRAAVYAARLLSGQAKKGDHYKEVNRVYQIFFLDFVLFPDSDKVPRRYFMTEETEGDKLNEVMEVIFYEMPKLESFVSEYFKGNGDLRTLPPEKKWCIFFKYRSEKKMEKMIAELINQEEGIMRADRALKKISRDEEQWARALFREKAAMDYRSGMYNARMEGYEQARQEYQEVVAEVQGKLAEARQKAAEAQRKLAEAQQDARQKLENLVRNLKERGDSTKSIAKLTGLSPKEINNL